MSSLRRRPPASGTTHALLYRRVSTDDQGEEGISLETQAKKLREYVAHQPDWIIHGEFEDIMSGKRADRPQYQAMLGDVRRLAHEGKRVAVVVFHLDRLGRDFPEAVNTRYDLKKIGVETHATDLGLVTDLIANIFMSVAEELSRQIGAKVAATRATIVQNGWYYGKTPWGYRGRPPTAEELAMGARPSMSQIEPDPNFAPLVQEVFQRVADGASVRSISMWLRMMPADKRGGRSALHQQLLPVLRSPTYIARACEGDDDVLARQRCRWEPLVSDELWMCAQKRVRGVMPRPQSSRHLLSGWMHCDVCDSLMTLTSHKALSGGYPRSGYRCTARGALPKCQRYVTAKHAERAVLDAVHAPLQAWFEFLSRPGLREPVDLCLDRANDNEPMRSELQTTLAGARKRLKDAAKLVVDGVLDTEAYKALQSDLVAEINYAETELVKLKASNSTNVVVPFGLDAARVADMIASLNGTNVVMQRSTLELLVKRCSVYRVGREYQADITWTPLGQWISTALVGVPVAA